MNSNQRKVLTDFKLKRKHVVVDGCDDPDCKKEFDAALCALLALCDDAEKANRKVARKSSASKEMA